jgi:TAG lipase / steryl ester hydrolase / phospholipase A2 / LPA acyltransferase
MSVLLATISPRSPLLWSCVGIYADIVKICSPSKTLRKIASEVAAYSRRPSPSPEKVLLKRLDEAETLADYEACAIDLDNVQGHEGWKKEDDSIEPDYRPDAIREQIVLLKNAMADHDIHALQYLLRTSLSREFAGINNLRLYKHSFFGTKKLIDDYINTVLRAIEVFTEICTSHAMPATEVLQHQQALDDSLKFLGRSALTLSGGALLGMKHIGVVKTLWESELLPEIISGASAGSIVAGIVGSSTDERMAEVLDHFPFSDLDCFDPPGTGRLGWVIQRARTFWRTRAFFEMGNLKRVMQSWVGDITFQEAYNKTGRTLNVCVSSSGTDEPRLLNYMTAPDVYIWSAVCASCAVPGVFSPANIYEKDPETREPALWMANVQQTFVDGSLDHDIPTRKLSEMFNVNFFIVSQVNPHVRLFLDNEEEFSGKQPTRPVPAWTILQDPKEFIRQTVIHRAHQISALGAPRICYRWASLLNQQYTGDINILPVIHPTEYLSMMMNPSSDFMVRATVAGERATWPRMCRIKNCVAIEMALSQAMNSIKERIYFGPEARAARQRNRANLSRRRSGRGHSRQPSFLRRRSLSIESELNDSGLMTPIPLNVRRNVSLNNIAMRPGFLAALTPRTTPLLSPQAGIGTRDLLGESLTMTEIVPPRTTQAAANTTKTTEAECESRSKILA